jgi:predicted nucleotidyltransferase
MTNDVDEIRAFLIAESFRFIKRVEVILGVTRIAIIGSLATVKADPKDVDILVTVDNDLDLTALAAAARSLKGMAQSKNRGADIFLANPEGHYIGRICHWRNCGPGIRASCDAHHCGQRHFLHDDFSDIKLESRLVREPPIIVWPVTVYRVKIPGDLLSYLSQYPAATSTTY